MDMCIGLCVYGFVFMAMGLWICMDVFLTMCMDLYGCVSGYVYGFVWMCFWLCVFGFVWILGLDPPRGPVEQISGLTSLWGPFSSLLGLTPSRSLF